MYNDENINVYAVEYLYRVGTKSTGWDSGRASFRGQFFGVGGDDHGATRHAVRGRSVPGNNKIPDRLSLKSANDEVYVPYIPSKCISKWGGVYIDTACTGRGS
ncbi:hypothetical protein AYI69_g1781 [Smittium culicis]|uniref:Uncharacterized protein n=1 Tax=Smittium culicis TaxID=133412 RepID=A0A1R1YPA0_9FUNG|nr:hypothetical protein AYI69_g1781 [Smittium culicis]